MQFSVISVGRVKSSPLREAIRDYEERAARYWPLKVVEVREEAARSITPVQVMDREAERLIAAVPAGSGFVTCEPGGEMYTSEEFARFLRDSQDSATSLAFIIGGAFGLGEAVRKRSVKRLALAPWVLPHEMARLVLVEQLYRAGTIRRGEPYHK